MPVSLRCVKSLERQLPKNIIILCAQTSWVRWYWKLPRRSHQKRSPRRDSANAQHKRLASSLRSARAQRESKAFTNFFQENSGKGSHAPPFSLGQRPSVFIVPQFAQKVKGNSRMSCTLHRPKGRYHILFEDFRLIAADDIVNASVLRILEQKTDER